jgi:D-glycero-D-manno-heptose 1,7-bisphosphate phosphatase
MASPAVFIERDNVLMADPGYMGGPDAVKLLPGVELAIKSLRQAGLKIVVVTNQPGIARGLLTEENLEATHSRLRQILADKQARLDAIYYCPNHPDGSVDRYASDSDNRMPKPGLLRQAAEEMNLDLSRSWMVGATPAAIGAGQHAGCRSVRIKTPDSHGKHDAESATEDYQADHHVRNLVDAARVIMREAANAPKAGPAAKPTPPKPPVDRTEETPRPKRPQTPGEPPSPPEPDPAVDADAETDSQDASPLAGVAAAVEDPQPRDDAHTPDQAPVGPETAFTPDDSTVRQEILRHVRQMVRQQDVHEFSLTNVIGGIAQMFAGLCLLLGIIMAVGYEDLPRGQYWVLVAILLQTTSLTFFVMGRNQR